mmetsp:Transcript_156108/g.479096  ORF Transcript_156108/g.479096 Transcript_156108/m.479096 type:complete len:124 (+) Transcript_156108:3-374(+)
MTSPRMHHAAAVLEGMIYVTGGRRPGADTVYATVESYDPGCRTWTVCRAMQMPRPRAGHAVATMDGQLFVLGGHHRRCSGLSSERSVERLNLAASSWEALEPMTDVRASFFAGFVTLGPAAVP